MSHAQQIHNFLKPPGRTLTGAQAFIKFGCLSLSQRIDDLRKQNIQIDCKMVKGKNGKYYGKYFIK